MTRTDPTARRVAPAALLAAAALALLGAAPAAAQQGAEDPTEDAAVADSGYGLDEEARPIQELPDRPDLLLEIGEDYLAPGPLGDGFTLPTGATWRPALWVYGTFRSGLQSFETGAPPGTPSATNSEWANRLDLVANLRLTGTERLVVEYRPFGLGGGLGYQFGDNVVGDRWEADLEEQLQSFFFEGDIGEIFPDLDDDDTDALDFGFSVGRQTVALQEGLVIADNLDAVGLTRNSLRPSGFSNLRITGLYAWNQVHRRNLEVESAKLVALSNQADLPGTTVSLDLVYSFADVSEAADGLYAGASAVQRLWIGDQIFNTAFRLAGSMPMDEPAAAAGLPTTVGEGALLMTEVSWTPHGEYGLWYVNGFWAAGDYTPAAREVGGPLGRMGILFASPGLGRFGAALNPVASDAVGGTVGRQLLFDGGRRQLVFEAAGRAETDDGGGSGALGVRFQQALGRRFILRLDGFAVARDEGDPPLGIRAETTVKF